jgi:hypothetical protein
MNICHLLHVHKGQQYSHEETATTQYNIGMQLANNVTILTINTTFHMSRTRNNLICRASIQCMPNLPNHLSELGLNSTVASASQVSHYSPKFEPFICSTKTSPKQTTGCSGKVGSWERSIEFDNRVGFVRPMATRISFRFD